MAPGEHGKITERSSGGKYYVTTYVRDSDGRRRRVERSSDKSAEDARRLLQRHLAQRRAPLANQTVTEKTTLAELFTLWLASKGNEDGVKPQTVKQYSDTWRVHGLHQIGALCIGELPTSRANALVQAVAATAPAQAQRLRMILRGMFSLAVRFDVLSVNPAREVKRAKSTKKAIRAATPDEFQRVRAAVRAYAGREHHSGPAPGRLLPAYIEVLAATGDRPNEVLGMEWSDVDLLADPPTATVAGQVVDHGRVEGKGVHRVDYRKGDAPPHTVILPKFGVEALTALYGRTGPSGPVFANRDGGWMSLANMRRCLRAALPEDLRWVTPHSFRRTVGTVVRDEHGIEAAQQQLSHATLATTEAHYAERRTTGPDVRAALDKFAGGKVENE